MTKRYGLLVGTPKQAFPTAIVDMGLENATDVILVRDKIILAAAPAADVISLGVIGWDSIIDPIGSDLYFDALGASTTLSIGDVTYPAALAAATDTHTAAGSVKALKAITIGNWYEPLWQTLGYATLAAAKLIGNQCELLATIAGGAATGNVAWQLKGQRRI